MRNTGLDEAQAGIKIPRRNINNLRYKDDTMLMAESEEELKSLLMKVKVESEKAGLILNIQKTTTQGLNQSLLCFLHFRSVTQSCLTLSDPMDCSLPGSPVHGLFQVENPAATREKPRGSHLLAR